MIEVLEMVGSRDFSAHLQPNGVIIVKENGRERTRMTMSDALATLTEERQTDEDILEATIEDMLRSLIHDFARAV